jgi:flagellar assembly factor FliW
LKIPSVTFGEVEIDPSTVFTFKDGIPGLRGINQYAIIESDDLAPFRWLQACQPNYLSLMTLDPVFIDANYKIRLAPLDREDLEVTDESDLMIQSLIVVPEDPKQMTANLLAPVVLNRTSMKGKQVVVEGPPDLLRVNVIKS